MFSLKTLHLATSLQIFEQCKNHLLTQNKKSVNDINTCQYRGNDNCKCAAGCFISDDEYSPMMENVPTYHLELIKDLQCVHDTCSPICWPERLNRIEKLILTGYYKYRNSKIRNVV